MPRFGKRSRERLATCHVDLQAIFNEVIKNWDCTILEGHRAQWQQDYFFDTGKSQVKWPDSRHNLMPSMAADVMPYHPVKPHIHWSNKDEIKRFADFVLDVADRLRHKGEISHRLRWGGDWDMDGNPVDVDPDESFFDGPHYELS